MCGIIGIIGKKEAAPILLEGLKRLEYRGYDSAGIATLVNGSIDRRRAEGKLANLAERVTEQPISGTVGIGHTRWATHGVPNEANAHPHATDRVAIVHNGIIENYKELRSELVAKGCNLASDTDTEVIVHLITQELLSGKAPAEATAAPLHRLEGAFALAIIFSGHHEMMIGARRGSPLAVGFGDGEMFLGSDALALAPLTDRIMYLEDGDWVVLDPTDAKVFDADDQPVERPIRLTELSGAAIGKGGYRHFMLKEIYEQPQVIGDTLQSFINPASRTVTMPDLPFDPAELDRLTLVACGTSYYACLTAKYWFETLARIPVEVDIASEFRYREPPISDRTVALFVSQSGETADTLAALRYCEGKADQIVSVVNVPESSIARESDLALPIYAGIEVGVASTKAFTCQLTVLLLLALKAAAQRGEITPEQLAEHLSAMRNLPATINAALAQNASMQSAARKLSEARDVLFFGRGLMYPLALEGALKMKEISYIHAEAYASGELKHGPIALVDKHVPVVVMAPRDNLFDKTVSNMQEVMARKGKVVLISDNQGLEEASDGVWASIEMPSVPNIVAPIVYAIPAQLLAYHTAVAKGTDVDQPRNLAKSVTVE
mgnify:CR=1 FL=1